MAENDRLPGLKIEVWKLRKAIVVGYRGTHYGDRAVVYNIDERAAKFLLGLWLLFKRGKRSGGQKQDQKKISFHNRKVLG